MKSHTRYLALLVALVGSFAIPPLSAGNSHKTPMAYPVTRVTLKGIDVVRIGAADSTVRYHLGSPDRRFGHDVWAYTGFQGDLEQSQELGCNTLVITFEGDRVADIKLVNARALKVLARSPTALRPGEAVASAKP